jgi:hypothetical protein
MVRLPSYFLALAWLSALSCWFVAGSAVAQTEGVLDPIREEIAQIRYPEAAKALNGLLEGGGLSLAELVEAHRLGGEIYAALGDEGRAHAHFVSLLTLDPDASLPPGTSPKISVPFEKARAWVSSPLRVHQVASRDGATVKVELMVDSDPLDMVASLRVHYGVGKTARLEQVADAFFGTELAFQVAGAEVVRLQAIALDQYGNEVAIANPGVVELVADAEGDGSAIRGASTTAVRAWYAQWYTYAAVGAAAAGAGVYFGVRSRADADDLESLSDNSTKHQYSDALAIEERGKRNALLANLSFGTAGLATVAAVICLVRARQTQRDTAMAPLVTRHGAGVSLKQSF